MSEDQPTVQLPAPGNDLIPGMVTVVDEAAPTTPPPIAAQPVSLAATPAQPSGFDLVLRGYERHQVDRYVYHLTVLLEELRSRLGDSSQREAVATAELADVRAELERGRPSFEALGERVSKMLTLAESEAAQLRADAERDAKALRHASEREAAEIRTAAHRDAEELGAAARREVSDLTERRVVLLSDIAGARDQRRVDVLEDDLAGDDDPGDVLAGRHLVHHREQHLFHDGAQAAGAGAAQDGLVGDRLEGVVGELQLDAVELEEPLVLADQGVLGLGEDPDQRRGRGCARS